MIMVIFEAIFTQACPRNNYERSERVDQDFQTHCVLGYESTKYNALAVES